MPGKLKSVWLVLLALLIAPAASLAQPGVQHIKPQLEAEMAAPAPGQQITLALAMRPDRGWHGYWRNPGDAGVPLSIDWRLPDGAQVGAFRYPVPTTLMIAGLMNHIYEHEYALLAPLTIPATARPGDRLRIEGRAEWLACTDAVCVPERGAVALDLTVGDGRVDPARRARFDAWRAKLPKPLGSPARFEVAGTMVRIAVPLPASVPVSAPHFFAATENAVAYAAPQSFSRSGDTLVIELPAQGRPAALSGVLRIDETTGLELDAGPGPVPAAGEPVGGAAAPAWTWALVAAAFGGAVLGGLLLNVMPCVFPILSLKALSLARAGESEGMARREGLAYSAGAIGACLALGGFLLALRAGGEAVGWAFQLQSPAVVFALLLLMVAITLNLAGLFELRGFGGGEALAARSGTAGAFWTGVLAAFVATPCTGPFMGAALGAAIVLPTWIGLGIFGALGLGLALPFLAIAFVPAIRRRMPRPGPWMATFRRWMAVPMALTALALLWLLWRQTGALGLAVGVASAAALALILWLAGRGGRTLGVGAAFASLALLGAGAAAAQAAAGAKAEASRPGLAMAQSFSEERLQRLRAQNRPVFAYFTADWCITCKANEKAAIERAEVAKAFERGKVAVLVGDWTRGDPAIGRFLEAQGRSGVPLYLYYRPGAAKPEMLPQVLTSDMLVRLSS